MEILISALLLFGLFFLLTGTLGLLRFRDVYSRMHATSKSTTLGVTGVLLAALLYLRFLGFSSGLKESLIIGFLFLTTPVGAHVIARAAYRAGVPLWQGGIADEFKAWQDKERLRSVPTPQETATTQTAFTKQDAHASMQSTEAEHSEKQTNEEFTSDFSR